MEENQKEKIKSFTDLIAWKESHSLVMEVYRITKRFPKDEQFGLTNQIRRAVVSITSNIAEGFSRQSFKEKVQFYSMSLGSLTEVQNQLLIARDIGYLNKEDFDKMADLTVKINKLLNGLIKSIKNYNNINLKILLYPLLLATCYLLLSSSASAGTIIKAPAYLGLNNGLVGCWNFDGSYDKVPDCSGNGNTGTITGAVQKQGKIGQALTFDGVNDNVVLPDRSLPTTFTFSVWLNVSDVTDHRTIFSVNGRNFAIEQDTAQIRYWNNGAGGSGNFGALPLNTWQHVVYTYSGTSLRAYLNGIQIGNALSSTISSGTDVTTIGDSGGTEYLKGLADEFRLYNRALSANEISRLYRIGLGSTVNSGTFLNPGRYTGVSFDTAVSGSTIPQGITVYGDYLWIVDQTDDEVYKYNLDGSYTGVSFDTAGSGNGDPRGIAVYNNFFWVADATDAEVYKYNLDGSYTGVSFDTAGSGNGDPRGIAVYNNFFWVADITDDEVYKYNSDGSYTGVSFDIASNGISDPSGIVFHNAFLWIVDQTDDEVYKYNLDGSYTGVSFDTAGSGNGDPRGIAVYNNFFWVADVTDTEVYKYYVDVPSIVNSSRTDVMTSGLVGYWTFDGPDISGTRAKDRSGNENHGTITGAVQKQGKVGQGLSFDGVDDVTTVSAAAPLNDLGPMTVSAWIYVTDSIPQFQRIVTKDTAVSNGAWIFSYIGRSSGTVCFGIASTNRTIYFTKVSTTGEVYNCQAAVQGSISGTNVWRYVTVTWDGTGGAGSNGTGTHLYIDGQEAAYPANTSGGAGGAGSDAAYNLHIGNRGDQARPFNGLIDDVRIYNRALSAAEINKLYQMGR